MKIPDPQWYCQPTIKRKVYSHNLDTRLDNLAIWDAVVEMSATSGSPYSPLIDLGIYEFC